MEAYINIALIFIVIVAFSVFVANRVKKNRESIEEKDINDIPSLLTAQDKFDILINEYKKSFGYEALNELIKKYNLAELKYVDGSSKPSYVITEDDIHNIYEAENLNVSFEDKMNVVVQRIYQKYKGYSSIDEVRDMNIDRCITVVYLGFQKVS